MPFTEIYRAHGEILAALTSFNDNVGQSPGERLQTLMRLDEDGRDLQQILCKQYFNQPATLNQVENSLWSRIFSLYWQLKRGYRALIREHRDNPGGWQTRSNLALITTRALHYSAATFKWGYFRHAPVDPKVWRSLHKLYRASEQGRFATQRIKLYEGGEHTSCSAEYVRILLLDLLGPLSLSPTQIEIADQWLRRQAKSVLLEEVCDIDRHLFYVDFAEAAGPRKFSRGVSGAKMRYLAMAELLGRIDDIIAGACDLVSLSRLEVVEDWQQAMNIELASPTRTQWASRSVMRPHPREAAKQTQKLFEHFRTQWSGNGHKRQHSREDVCQTVEVVCDFPAICTRLRRGADEIQAGSQPKDRSIDESSDDAGQWTLQNRSGGGYGLSTGYHAQGRIRVGGLLGLEIGSEAEGWEIGAIRRIIVASADEIAVGVETLSSAPKLVELSGMGGLQLAEGKNHTGTESLKAPPVEAILLSPMAELNASGSLILPVADYPSRIIDLHDGDRSYRIRLTNVLERTEDWIQVEFVSGEGDPGSP